MKPELVKRGKKMIDCSLFRGLDAFVIKSVHFFCKSTKETLVLTNQSEGLYFTLSEFTKNYPTNIKIINHNTDTKFVSLTLNCNSKTLKSRVIFIFGI